MRQKNEKIISTELGRLRRKLPKHDSGWSESVRVLAAFIDDNYHEPWLNVAQARKRCKLHNNNISSIFKYEVGQSVREYIEVRRLGAAKHFVENYPKIPMYQVALSVGYKTAESYNRAFRRFFGGKPSDFKPDKKRQSRSASRAA